jgi:hypothetical protein
LDNKSILKTYKDFLENIIMGCDYYIYTVLKIVHKDGIKQIILKTQEMYLNGDSDDFNVHPLKRVDHMKIDVPDVLVYKKGELEHEPYIEKYMEKAKEYIKYNLDVKYELNNVDDILEMYIIEMRKWRN